VSAVLSPLSDSPLSALACLLWPGLPYPICPSAVARRGPVLRVSPREQGRSLYPYTGEAHDHRVGEDACGIASQKSHSYEGDGQGN